MQGGHLSAPLRELHAPLDKIIGTRVTIEKVALRRYLTAHNIAEASLGGSLDEPLSPATLPDGMMSQARYFIIHDVGTPNYLERPFLPNINDATWEWNDLQKRWAYTKVAHVFINRVGDSVAAVGFCLCAAGETLRDKVRARPFAGVCQRASDSCGTTAAAA